MGAEQSQPNACGSGYVIQYMKNLDNDDKIIVESLTKCRDQYEQSEIRDKAAFAYDYTTQECKVSEINSIESFVPGTINSVVCIRKDLFQENPPLTTQYTLNA